MTVIVNISVESDSGQEPAKAGYNLQMLEIKQYHGNKITIVLGCGQGKPNRYIVVDKYELKAAVEAVI